MTEPTWQKSTYSEEGSACVEIARAPTIVRVRDSKTPEGPRLALRPTAWADFVPFAAWVGAGGFQQRDSDPLSIVVLTNRRPGRAKPR